MNDDNTPINDENLPLEGEVTQPEQQGVEHRTLETLWKIVSSATR